MVEKTVDLKVVKKVPATAVWMVEQMVSQWVGRKETLKVDWLVDWMVAMTGHHLVVETVGLWAGQTDTRRVEL